MKTWLHSPLVLLLGFFLVGYVFMLGVRPLLRPDETRYAEIAREMNASGDWLVPRLAGIRYFEKPSLGHQLNAASLQLFGENPFGVRFSSMAATLLTGLFLAYLMWKKTRDPLACALGTGIFWNFGMVFGVGTFAVLDMPLCCALTLAIGCFYRATEETGKLRILLWLTASGLFAAGAFLLKGLLGFAIPAMVLAPYLIWQKEWKKLFLYPLVPLVVALLAITPWSLAIHRAEPDFWNYFLVEEHWNRFTSKTYDRKPEPFWYFIPVLLGGILPSGLLGLAAWRQYGKSFWRDPFHRLLLCWAAIPFLFFSISSCKLGTYILPCFPPLALLFARGIRAEWEAEPKYLSTVWNWILRILGWTFLTLAGAAALGIGVLVLLDKWKLAYEPSRIGWTAAGILLVSIAAYLAFRAIKQPCLNAKAGFTLGMLAAALAGGVPLLPTAAFLDRMPEAGLREGAQKIQLNDDDILLLDRSVIAPAAWVYRRSTPVVYGRPGELQYGLQNYPEEYKGRYYDYFRLDPLLKNSRKGKRVFIIFDSPKKRQLAEHLKPVQKESAGGLLFVRF